MLASASPSIDTTSRVGAKPSGVFVLAVLAVASIWVVHAQAWRFICDDAYIAFRYALHLAEAGQLDYNLEGPHVEGYTSPLWVVLLAAGQRLGTEPPTAAAALTTLGSALGLVAVVLLLRALRGRTAQPWQVSDLLPATGLVLAPEFMVWSHSGLETSFSATVVVFALWASVRQRIGLAAAAVLGALFLRLDNAVPLAAAALVGLIKTIATSKRSTFPFRRFALALVCVLVPLAAHLWWRHDYYGAWWPNTWQVKRYGGLLRDTFGTAYITSWAEHLHLWGWLPLAAWLRSRHAIVVVPVVAVVFYAWSVGGDFMGYGRFLVVATVLAYVLGAWLLLDVHAWLRSRWQARGSLVFGAIVVGVLIGWVTQAIDRHQRDLEGGWLDHRFESVQAMHEFATVRAHVGQWMRQHLPADTRLTVGAAGALPYVSGLFAIDAYGLVDPTLPEQVAPREGKGVRPGHQFVAPLDHLLGFEPDLLCHLGWQGPQRPSAKLARRRTKSRDYRWACIDYPALVDGRAAEHFEPGVYCCLQPRDRSPEPFTEGGL